jgi:hypothetical protein
VARDAYAYYAVGLGKMHKCEFVGQLNSSEWLYRSTSRVRHNVNALH